MPQMLAFTLVLAVLYAGDVVATRTKAWIPSVFVCAVLFLAGFWTFFPQDIMARAGIPPAVSVLAMYIIVVNMGTLLSVRELMRQWKTIAVSLAGIAGIIGFGFTLGYALFDKNTVIVAIPPLVGGLVSSIIMSKGAEAAGLINLSVFAIILYVMQGFAGYPITAIMLKREGIRVLAKYRAGEWVEKDNGARDTADITGADDAMPRMFNFVPKPYNTDYFKFLRVGLVAFLAWGAAEVMKPVADISPFVLCLVFGVLAASCGFLERHPLYKANGFGFVIMALMLFIFDALKRANPEMLLELVPPLVVFILCAIAGMYVTSWLIGKAFGMSTAMAYAISLTALYGFPADYVITIEGINALTSDPGERRVLTDHMLAPMLVGGFISVTMVSVLLAGIMVNWIVPVAS